MPRNPLVFPYPVSGESMQQRLKSSLMSVVGVTAVSIVIGVFLTVIGVAPLLENLVVSLCIGLISVLVPETLATLFPSARRRLLVYFAGIPLGALAGILLIVFWHDPDAAVLRHIVLQVLAASIVLGGATATLFYLLDRKLDLEQELHAAELRKVEAERSGLEAQLKMLQAQIEPHFLFNTLANIAALISTDAALARRLLDRLIVYLRATLARTRAGGATLGDEIELLRAYLEIHRIRMGERLHYRFDVPAPLSALPFPPMLLQPLVENAVKHGLEPKVAEGTVHITASNSEARLRIAIADNGIGLGNSESTGTGTGIANVRARLTALYGDAARLALEENPDGGVTATLELPV